MPNWRSALQRTRRAILQGVSRPFRVGADMSGLLEEWEEALVRADIPVRLVMDLLGDLAGCAPDSDTTFRQQLAARLCDCLKDEAPVDWRRQSRPLCVLLVGVNGSGKTTTAAKLARWAQAKELTPLLAAGDTFRAAGSEQLAVWAERLGCRVIAGGRGTDSAAVAYDAMQAGLAQGADLVLIDTAGRMHTKQPLMQELRKIHGALGKAMPGAPHETWLVLDASIGNNALVQAKTFNETVPLSGVIVAKLDGSAKAGFLFALGRELDIPVRFAGIGEGADDLVPFDPVAFVDALLGG